MRALVLIHRWLGVAFCLLFAMWFASGMVMHIVPFPALVENERVAGLAPFSPQGVAVPPRDALRLLEVHKAWRLRLDRKSTRLNSSHIPLSRMPSSA